MWRSISEIFSFRYSGLQQVPFYSFYNTWSMIGSPPATLAVQWVSAGERERLHFLLFMVVLWLLWPHAKVSFPPIELWCMEPLLKIGYKSLALETDSWYLIGAFSNKLPVFFLCLQVSLPPLNNQKSSRPRFASLDWYFQSDCILAADFVLMKVYQPCLFCMWFTNL